MKHTEEMVEGMTVIISSEDEGYIASCYWRNYIFGFLDQHSKVAISRYWHQSLEDANKVFAIWKHTRLLGENKISFDEQPDGFVQHEIYVEPTTVWLSTSSSSSKAMGNQRRPHVPPILSSSSSRTKRPSRKSRSSR